MFPDQSIQPSSESTGKDLARSKQPARWRSVAALAAALSGLLALTFFEARAVALIQGNHLDAQRAVAAGILTGHPAWRLYQSRLLGPFLVGAVAHATGHSFDSGYDHFCVELLFLSNAVCYALFLRRDRARAWGYTLLYAGLFVALQDARWLYLWDFIDLTTLLCFAALVFGERRPWLLAGLFLVELLNREAALFVGLWMVIDAVSVSPAGGAGRRLHLNGPQIAAGAALILIGAAWTHWVRGRLFVAQTAPPATGGTVGDQLWQLQGNLQVLADPAKEGFWITALVLGGLALLLARAWRPLGPQAVPVALLLGAMAASLLLFAQFNETRVWLEFTPFALFLWHTASSPAAPPPPHSPPPGPGRNGQSAPAAPQGDDRRLGGEGTPQNRREEQDWDW